MRVLISRPSSICFLRIAAFRSRLRFFIQHLSQAVKFDTQVYVSQTSVLYGATWVRMYQPLRLPFLLVRSVARAKKRVTLTEKRQWQDQCSFRWVGCWRKPFAPSRVTFSTLIDPSCITCGAPAPNGGRSMSFDFSHWRPIGLRPELGSSFNLGGENLERERTRRSGARPYPERSTSVCGRAFSQ